MIPERIPALAIPFQGLVMVLDQVVVPPPVPIQIVAGANTTSVDQGGGLYRVTKTAGAGGWNAAAISATGISGDFVLKYAAESGDDHIVGVSDAPAADSASVDAGLYTSGASHIKVLDGSIGGQSTNTLPSWIWRIGDNVIWAGMGATLAAARAATEGVGKFQIVTRAGTFFGIALPIATGNYVDIAFGEPSLFP